MKLLKLSKWMTYWLNMQINQKRNDQLTSEQRVNSSKIYLLPYHKKFYFHLTSYSPWEMSDTCGNLFNQNVSLFLGILFSTATSIDLNH